MFTFPAFHLGAFAPLREVKSWNRKTLESGQSGMLSYWLPVSLTPFHHPSLALPCVHPSVHRIPENFNAIGLPPNGIGFPAGGGAGRAKLGWRNGVKDTGSQYDNIPLCQLSSVFRFQLLTSRKGARMKCWESEHFVLTLRLCAFA